MPDFQDPGPRLTMVDVHACEQRLGVIFPSDYRAYLLRHNGGHVSPSDISLPEIDDGEVEVRCLYGVGRPEGSDLERSQRSAGARRIGKTGVVIGDDSLGNEWFLSTATEDAGVVYFADLDSVWGQTDRPVPMYRVAGSFTQFLSLLRDLSG